MTDAPFEPRLAGGIAATLRATAKTTPDRVYARFAGDPISFGEVDRQSDALAAALARRGVAHGDRVAVMLPNSRQSFGLLFGLTKLGAVWVPINTQQRGEGLAYLLRHADPRLLIIDAGLLQFAQACGIDLDGLDIIVHRQEGSQLDHLLSGDLPFEAPLPAPDDLFAIMYTSGTTGPPKGALVTHRMMAFAGEGVLRVADARSGDVLFVWEPLHHIGGAQLLTLPLLEHVELAMVPRFSASRFWADVAAAGATHIHYLGGILQILLNRAASPAESDHKVRVAWGGGCPADIWRMVEARFGFAVHECYGMTEASSITTYTTSGPPGTVGRPVPWLAVSIRDNAGRTIAGGERGEIVTEELARGALFPGYFRDPATTARTLREGRLHTGDLGSIDADGNLRFHGRLTESIRCRGENVSAWEIEHVVAQHPDVEACAVIGVAAEIGEQDIKLFVEPKPGRRFDAAALSGWLEPRLAPYQQPRFIETIDGFERTASQRIMKHRLDPAPRGGFERAHRVR